VYLLLYGVLQEVLPRGMQEPQFHSTREAIGSGLGLGEDQEYDQGGLPLSVVLGLHLRVLQLQEGGEVLPHVIGFHEDHIPG
jgi:hypothetical protein